MSSYLPQIKIYFFAKKKGLMFRVFLTTPLNMNGVTDDLFNTNISIMVPFIVLSIVFVASSDVPQNETSRLRDPDQLRETQRRYQTLLQSFSQCNMIFAVLLTT